MKILIGLGNPGQQYETTRHNVGWMALDRLAERVSSKWRTDRRFRASLAEVTLPGIDDRLLLVKPLTFMNLSGEAARAVVDFYKVPVEDVLVITDDMALPLGFVRVRPRGSDGGHNGLKSLVQHLGGQDFTRIRVGVGAPAGDAIGHVLGTFQREEWPYVHQAVDTALDALEVVLREGVPEAMNRYNRRASPELSPDNQNGEEDAE